MLRPLASFSLSVVSFILYFVAYRRDYRACFDNQTDLSGKFIVLLQRVDRFFFCCYHHHCVIAIAEIVLDVQILFHKVIYSVDYEIAYRLACECTNR